MLLLTVQCAVEIGSGYFMSRNGGTGGCLCHPMGEFKGLAAVGFCWWISFFPPCWHKLRSLESRSCRGSISVTGGSFQSAYSLSHKSVQVAESHFGLASFQTFLLSSF